MLKRFVYRLCKSLGLFAVARRITRHELRILAYHGSALDDDADFRPQLFMDATLFKARLEYLRCQGFPVLNLDDAVQLLRRNSLPPCATVVTIDDGFFSTWKLAVPMLVQLGLPATIYLTSYYSVHETPVFRLVVQYMFWKTRVASLLLSDIGVPNGHPVTIDGPSTAEETAWTVIEYGETALAEDERVELCKNLGVILDVDYEDIVRKRLFSLMTVNEVRAASEQGIEIQLHTHRHRLPIDPNLLRREIDDNRRVVEPIVGRAVKHFCYPSGIHDPSHLGPLRELGVTSATTCEVGLNPPATDPLLLNRFLDGNTISWLEFEAEMSGFAELLRRRRYWLRSRLRIVGAA